MKKYTLFAICLFFTSFLFAQDSYSPKIIEKATKLTQQMNVSLNLSPVQKTEIQTINLEIVKRLNEAILNDNDKNLLKSKVQAINTYRDDEFRRLLTSQQFAKLKSNSNGRNCCK